MATPRIYVTNDDGIDSVGLHILARALADLGDVTIIAPNEEFSGAGASIGALHLIKPEARSVSIEGIDTSWAVNGPPGLCILFARLGAFGPPPDLIVSGINPGANVGRAVYHSGTIGAVLTGRNGMIPGLAVSQSVDSYDLLGQGYDEMLAGQRWDSAATIAASLAGAMLAQPPEDAGVLNLNVPNLDVADMKEWRWTEVGQTPPRAMSKAELKPLSDSGDTYEISLSWGSETTLPPGSDTVAMQDDAISVTWLSRITALQPNTPGIDAALDGLLAPQG